MKNPIVEQIESRRGLIPTTPTTGAPPTPLPHVTKYIEGPFVLLFEDSEDPFVTGPFDSKEAAQKCAEQYPEYLDKFKVLAIRDQASLMRFMSW